MATSASTTGPLGDASGDLRIDRVLDEFSISKGSHVGYRIEPMAERADCPQPAPVLLP